MTAKPDTAFIGLHGSRNLDLAENLNNRRSGVVKWFSRARGYGFIVDFVGAGRNRQARELFFHHSQAQIDGPPEEGDRVTYLMVDGPKGPAAHDVRLEAAIEDAP